MRGRTFWSLLGMGIVAALAALIAAAPAQQPPRAWEYKYVRTEYEPSKLEQSDGPNSLGAEGWELVCATADANQYVLYFKRPKQR